MELKLKTCVSKKQEVTHEAKKKAILALQNK